MTPSLTPRDRLENWLRRAAATRRREEALQPLPPVRELGERFGLSHATAFRLLSRLEEEGVVWRAPNGRFHPFLAGRLHAQPLPLAAMLRQMRGWSSLCRAVMEGFTEACGEGNRGMLLLPHRELVEADAPLGPIRLAPISRQRSMLEDHLLLHGEGVEGVLLDELWSDEALATLPDLPRSVIFHRQTSLDAIGNIAADHQAGAALALGYLRERGYRRIILPDPLPEYEAAAQTLAAVRSLDSEVEYRPLPDPQAVTALLKEVAVLPERVALLVAEDNLALELLRLGAGLPWGRQIGLLSIMGCPVTNGTPLSVVSYDFREMGRRAAQWLCEPGQPRVTHLSPTLRPRATT